MSPESSIHGRVASDRAYQLLAQLSAHLATKAGAHGGVRLSDDAGDGHAVADFGWARCEIRADRNELSLYVHAEDSESLDAARGFLTVHVADLGAVVEWDDGASIDWRTSMRDFHRRARGTSKSARPHRSDAP